MLGWIIGGGGVALLALFFVIGTVAQKKHGEDMVSGGTSYIRFAAAVILSTLLERVQRPEMTDEENAQRIDIARVFPAAMAAGQKVFGDAMTEDLMKDELKTVVQYRANHLIGVKEHEMHELAKKKCPIERKDDIILAAMTAMQLNYQEPAEQFSALRLFAIQFYDNALDGDRRMLGVDGPVNLLEVSIEHSNEIVRALNAMTDARSAGDAGA